MPICIKMYTPLHPWDFSAFSADFDFHAARGKPCRGRLAFKIIWLNGLPFKNEKGLVHYQSLFSHVNPVGMVSKWQICR